jgi:hypothetical protein
MSDRRSVRLRVLVERTQPGARGRFGLQDKKGALAAGERADGDAIAFECEATARPDDDGATARVTGPFVHNSGKERILYVSWRNDAGEWRRRLKIPIDELPWAEVEAAGEGGLLEIRVRDMGRPRADVLSGWRAARA